MWVPELVLLVWGLVTVGLFLGWGKARFEYAKTVEANQKLDAALRAHHTRMNYEKQLREMRKGTSQNGR